MKLGCRASFDERVERTRTNRRVKWHFTIRGWEKRGLFFHKTRYYFAALTTAVNFTRLMTFLTFTSQCPFPMCHRMIICLTSISMYIMNIFIFSLSLSLSLSHSLSFCQWAYIRYFYINISCINIWINLKAYRVVFKTHIVCMHTICF